MTTSAQEIRRAFDGGVLPASMWLGEPYGEALAVLRSAVRQDEGIIVLTGEVGTGKTLLTRALLLRVRQDTIVGTLLFPRLEPLDLLRALADAYGLPSEFDSPDAFYPEFEAFLRRTGAAGKRVLFVIDEAQALPPASLSELERLLRPEPAPADGRAAFNVLLVGQDELRAALGEPRNASLAGRITAQCQLRPLTEAEVAAYLAHRLVDTGAQRPAFTTAEAREIHRASHGLPRVIDQLAQQTVSAAARIVTKPGEVAHGGDAPFPGQVTHATEVPRADTVARPSEVARAGDTGGHDETAAASEPTPRDVEPAEVKSWFVPEERDGRRRARRGPARSRGRRRAVISGVVAAAVIGVALGIAGYEASRGRDASVEVPPARETESDTASSTAPGAAATSETTSGSAGEGRDTSEPVNPPMSEAAASAESVKLPVPEAAAPPEPVKPPASEAATPAEPVKPPATPEPAKRVAPAEPAKSPAAARAPRPPATPDARRSVAQPAKPAAQAPAARRPAASEAVKAPATRDAAQPPEARQPSLRRRTAETAAPSRPAVAPLAKPPRDEDPAPRVEQGAPARPTAPAPRRPADEAQDAPDPSGIIEWLLKEHVPGR